MTKPAVACTWSHTLDAAARLMAEHDCGALPVVDNAGELAGIITDRDICMAAYEREQPLRDIRIEHAMSPRVYSCRGDDTVANAERVMAEHRVRRVPVVDDERRPIGMLSFDDIARNTAASPERDGVYREVLQTLAAICEPRT